MQNTIRTLLSTATDADEKAYGAGKNQFVPWDLSKKPKDNKDRVKKIGSGDQSHGMAFLDFDTGRKKVVPSDGISGPKPSITSAFAVMEPDCWVLRFHEKRGDGLDMSRASTAAGSTP